VRRRIFLGRLRARLKNRIHAELIRRGLGYENENLFARKGVPSLRALNMPALRIYRFGSKKSRD